MLVPICPLCTESMVELTNVSACACGHAFHHVCITSWKRLSARFKGANSCPCCGCGGGGCRHRRADASVLKLLFAFDQSPDPGGLEALQKLRSEMRKREKETSTMLDSYVREIDELEGKLKTLVELLTTFRESSASHDRTLVSERSRKFFSESNQFKRFFRANIIHLDADEKSKTGSVSAECSRAINRSKVLLAGLIQLASILNCEVSSGREVGGLKRPSSGSSIPDSLSSRDVPVISDEQVMSGSIARPSTPSYDSNFSFVDSCCQTDFIEDSEWDEEQYEVDWSYEYES